MDEAKSRRSAERLAAREARKKKILGSKGERMTKVLGEYNKHHTGDSDEDTDLTKFLSPEASTAMEVIEPANKGLRVVLFALLGALIFYGERSFSFKNTEIPLWSRVFVVVGVSHQDSVLISKYLIFIYNVILDFLLTIFSYSLLFYWYS